MNIHSARWRNRYILLGSTLLVLVLGGACQPITAERATLPWKAEMDVSASGMNELSEVEAVLVTRAAEDLAQTLGLDTADITLVGIEAVDWPDASLGCPEPDMMYAAMLTPGYKIVLSDGDTQYNVNTSTAADSRLAQCDR